MLLSLFDYDLPPERIALSPVSPREAAKMLVVGADGALVDEHIADFPDYLRAGDAVVVNDTRVIAARLRGFRARGENIAAVEATLIERVDASRWRALARPAKRLEVGERIRFGESSESMACLLAALDAEVVDKGDAGEVELAFAFSGPALDEAIERFGEMPLPPYIAARRPAVDADRRDYQTVFAEKPGPVAAPTAGVHLTPELIRRTEAAGASLHRVTLHVGAGTFLPLKVEDSDDHVMHAESGQIDATTAEALNEARARGGRIVAVGSTSLRLLESAAAERGRFEPFSDKTAIFITPGYHFRAVDALFTNFHLPRSTLLMLAAAFVGRETILSAYAHAIANGYRFYSYGDACWLDRAQG